MREIQGNINKLHSSIVFTVRTQLDVAKYFPDLHVINCIGNVEWWKKVRIQKLWRMNYE